MIGDADDSLLAWLTSLLPPGTAVRLGLPRPDGSEDDAGAPTLLVHLHRVQEDPDGADAGWAEVRSDEGVLVGRMPPMRRYRLTYLLTGAAADLRTEHQILGGVLAGTAASQVLPTDHLRGVLADDGHGAPSVVLTRCAPEQSHLDPAAMWAAWRLSPRAYLELTLLVPLPLGAMVTDLPSPPREIALTGSRREREPAPRAERRPPRQAPRRRPSVSEG